MWKGRRTDYGFLRRDISRCAKTRWRSSPDRGVAQPRTYPKRALKPVGHQACLGKRTSNHTSVMGSVASAFLGWFFICLLLVSEATLLCARLLVYQFLRDSHVPLNSDRPGAFTWLPRVPENTDPSHPPHLSPHAYPSVSTPSQFEPPAHAYCFSVFFLVNEASEQPSQYDQSTSQPINRLTHRPINQPTF